MPISPLWGMTRTKPSRAKYIWKTYFDKNYLNYLYFLLFIYIYIANPWLCRSQGCLRGHSACVARAWAQTPRLRQETLSMLRRSRPRRREAWWAAERGGVDACEKDRRVRAVVKARDQSIRVRTIE